MRIGLGYDVHAFVDARPLILGGVDIPYDRGLAGHSDADVLTHALMDALLGAMRLGDIGAHFPDTDEQFSGISSLELLRRVAHLGRDAGWQLIDADCVIIAEWPKMTPYRDRMRENLAECLGVGVSMIGIKATTTEGLGFSGRGEGVAAQAVVLMERAELE